MLNSTGVSSRKVSKIQLSLNSILFFFFSAGNVSFQSFLKSREIVAGNLERSSVIWMLFQLKAVCQFHFLDRGLWLRWSKHTHLFLSMKGLLHIKQTANIPFVVWIGTSWHSSESLAWWNASIDCRFIYLSSEGLTTTTTTNSVALLVLVYQEWICFNLGII